MATPSPALATLPLLPLARIARGLAYADLASLCGTCRGLRALRAELLPHARPSEVSRYTVPDKDEVPLVKMALSRDGARFAAILYDRSPHDRVLHVLRAYTGRIGVPVSMRIPKGERLSGVAFNDAQELCMILRKRGPGARIVNTNGGETVRTITSYIGHNAFYFTARHAMVHLVCESSTRMLFDHGDRRVLLELPQRMGRWNVRAAAFTDDLRLCALGDRDGWVYVWDTSTGAILHQLHAKDTKRVSFVALNDAGTHLVVAVEDAVYGWDLGTQSICARIPLKCAYQRSRFAVRGTFALVVNRYKSGGRVFAVDLASGIRARIMRDMHPGAHAVTLSPDCTRAVVATADGCVRTWHLGALSARLRRRGQRRAATVE